MVEYSVCVDAVFEGRDFLQSLEALRRLGFRHFEFWSWWDKDLDAIKAAKNRLGLTAAAFCTRFISLVDPASRTAYLDGLRESIAAARVLGCDKLISQVGDERPGVPRTEQHRSLVEGLKASAAVLEGTGITLMFEPLNRRYDHPGYYLWRAAEAFEIVDEVGSDQVRVIYDIYHQQIMEGDLINTIVPNIGKIAHFHCAGHPGRHEPDRGEINYPDIFAAIQRAGYTGCMGVEYFPLTPPEKWLPTLLSW